MNIQELNSKWWYRLLKVLYYFIVILIFGLVVLNGYTVANRYQQICSKSPYYVSKVDLTPKQLKKDELPACQVYYPAYGEKINALINSNASIDNLLAFQIQQGDKIVDYKYIFDWAIFAIKLTKNLIIYGVIILVLRLVYEYVFFNKKPREVIGLFQKWDKQ